MTPNSPFAAVEDATASLFLPLRRLFGPLHRRRPALGPAQADQEKRAATQTGAAEGISLWYARDFPLRHHNELTPLIHGDEYFPDLWSRVRAARIRVTISGWALTPLMQLLRGEAQFDSEVVDLLRAASEHAEVYVLLWSGAPFFFKPGTRFVEQIQRMVKQAVPRVHFVLDRRASFSHDHHQKAVTIDGRTAYVGGIDLCTFQGDRWDTAAHPLRFGVNWHDMQMRLQGEVVADVEENFRQRWKAVTGEDLAPIPPVINPSWDTPAQIVRTVPAGFYPFAPTGIYGIHHAYVAAITRAKRFIYLENQYLWTPEIVDALLAAMNRPHPDPFRIVIVLPAKAYLGKYDNDEHVRLLHAADRGRGIFSAYSLYAGGPGLGTTGYDYLPIYVHGKVGIIDDEWLTMGSANLNNRGLATDTEMNVQAIAPAVAQSLRIRLWAEHLGMSEEEVGSANPIDLIDRQWKNTAARRSISLKQRTQPGAGHIIPYVPGTTPRSRLLDIIQAATLEH